MLSKDSKTKYIYIYIIYFAAVSRYFIDYRYSDQDKKFMIDKSTGEVKLRNKLDREITAEHTVKILAKDKGSFKKHSNNTLVTFH